MPHSIRFFFDDVAYRISRRVSDTRYVLQLRDPSRLDRRILPGEKVFFFDTFADIPILWYGEISRFMGLECIQAVRSFFNEGGQLCVLTHDGCFASLSWVRAGDRIERWVIPLGGDDRVLSRGFTAPRFRGCGMYSRCIAATFDRVATAKGRFLADCHVRNAASLRQFKRTGFEIIARGRIRPRT